MIILHFDLQPQFKYMNYFIYTSHHAEDWWDSSDTCDTIETKKCKKNQVTKHKTVRKKKKTKKRRKSRKGTESVPKRRAREQDVIFTALLSMDKNDSRIPVLFSLTSSCAATFAAFKGKVLEACGLSLKNVQFFYLHKDLKFELCETTWAAFMHFLRDAQIILFCWSWKLCQAKLVLPFSRKSQAKAFLQPRCHQSFLVNHKIKAIQC